jgi:hypothetical protein
MPFEVRMLDAEHPDNVMYADEWAAPYPAAFTSSE